eukprot:10996877-Alexandrium_andersonii.AAC.1
MQIERACGKLSVHSRCDFRSPPDTPRVSGVAAHRCNKEVGPLPVLPVHVLRDPRPPPTL